jgi:hypothetical protein
MAARVGRILDSCDKPHAASARQHAAETIAFSCASTTCLQPAGALPHATRGPLIMAFVVRTLLVALLALLSVSAAHSADPPGAAASRPHPAKRPFPQLDLADRKSHGQRAIDLLGNRLPEVAEWHGKSPE